MGKVPLPRNCTTVGTLRPNAQSVQVPIQENHDQVNLQKIPNKNGANVKAPKTKSVPRKSKSKGPNPEAVENDCDKMIQEMEAAYMADLENNQMGKPSLNKLQVLERVMYKIKSPLFAEIF